jgi:hypothetical protein
MGGLIEGALIVAIALAAIVLAKSVKRVGVDERLIVERFGAHNRTSGPGWCFTLPLVERGILLPLADIVPGWKGYAEEQLRQKLVHDYYQKLARYDPSQTPAKPGGK